LRKVIGDEMKRKQFTEEQIIGILQEAEERSDVQSVIPLARGKTRQVSGKESAGGRQRGLDASTLSELEFPKVISKRVQSEPWRERPRFARPGHAAR
jgi:hypothetical protein